MASFKMLGTNMIIKYNIEMCGFLYYLTKFYKTIDYRQLSSIFYILRVRYYSITDIIEVENITKSECLNFKDN